MFIEGGKTISVSVALFFYSCNKRLLKVEHFFERVRMKKSSWLGQYPTAEKMIYRWRQTLSLIDSGINIQNDTHLRLNGSSSHSYAYQILRNRISSSLKERNKLCWWATETQRELGAGTGSSTSPCKYVGRTTVNP
jgi:hypothetical protein